MSISVVIASCRERSLQKWFDKWTNFQDFYDSEVIVVEDNPVKQFKIDYHGHENVKHFAWNDIDEHLGTNSWIIPRRTSAIKSFGFLEATGDIVWTLDDDCYPEDYRRETYFDYIEYVLSKKTRQLGSWYNTLELVDPGHAPYPRGYPYEEAVRQERPITVLHGLWSFIPDLDGITAKKLLNYRTPPALRTELIPYGSLFPMCGMNLAFKRREMLPAMYFMLQGSNAEAELYPFDRFDDIWAGLMVKTICDHFGYGVTTGAPSIVHTKESDPEERIRKEAPGIAAHEKLWKLITATDLSGCLDINSAYRRLAARVEWARVDLPEYRDYWLKLAEAMRVWSNLTEVSD